MCAITRVLIVAMIIILVASGCVSTWKETEEGGDNNMARKEEILKLVNNYSPADDLIKTLYLEEDLKDFFRLSILLREQPPECVRCVNGRIYFVYKYQEEGYLFLGFNSIDNDTFPSEWWYTDKKLYLKDFEKLTEAKAFSEDVKDLDPHGNYLSFYASNTTEFESVHFTVDGYMVTIYYGTVTDMDFGRIKKLTVLSGKDNPMYYNLLPIDKELLTK